MKPKLFINSSREKIKKKGSAGNNNEGQNEIVFDKVEANRVQVELDDQINSLLNNAQNNSTIQKHAVQSLVEELDIDGQKDEKRSREVCLSIPDLTDTYQEITLGKISVFVDICVSCFFFFKLDKNAYILENGTIVQPQGDSENVIIYVLDQTY
jgi:hypothetical protein